MCILFFMVGDADHPTVICNNRDEFYSRPTARGKIDEVGRYAPRDLIGGGTWLTFDRIIDEQLGMRFSVVLNYHLWREDESLILKEKELIHKNSRGILVSDFINGTMNAHDYARHVFEHRNDYRSFNLIVSDESGCYYISSGISMVEPKRIKTGKLYGITNGYLDHKWEKVELGIKSVTETITQRLGPVPSITDLFGNCELLEYHDIEEMQHNFTVDALKDLHSLMKDSSPCADPTFGHQYPALSRLASIYALPTHVAKSITTMETIEDMLRIYDLPSDGKDESTLFGTRTVTLLLHWSPDFVKKHSKQTDATNYVSRFIILEDDINAQQESSVRIITNLAAVDSTSVNS